MNFRRKKINLAEPDPVRVWKFLSDSNYVFWTDDYWTDEGNGMKTRPSRYYRVEQHGDCGVASLNYMDDPTVLANWVFV